MDFVRSKSTYPEDNSLLLLNMVSILSSDHYLVVNKAKSEVTPKSLDFQAHVYRPNSSIYMQSKNAKSSRSRRYIIIEFFSQKF